MLWILIIYYSYNNLVFTENIKLFSKFIQNSYIDYWVQYKERNGNENEVFYWSESHALSRFASGLCHSAFIVYLFHLKLEFPFTFLFNMSILLCDFSFVCALFLDEISCVWKVVLCNFKLYHFIAKKRGN